MRYQVKFSKIHSKHRIHGGNIVDVQKVASNIVELTKQFNNVIGKKPKKFVLKI